MICFPSFESGLFLLLLWHDYRYPSPPPPPPPPPSSAAVALLLLDPPAPPTGDGTVNGATGEEEVKPRHNTHLCPSETPVATTMKADLLVPLLKRESGNRHSSLPS